MKSTIYLIIFIIGINNIGVSQEVVKNTKILGPLESGYPTNYKGIPEAYSTKPSVGVMYFDIETPDRLNAIFIMAYIDGGQFRADRLIDSFRKWEINVQSELPQLKEEKDGSPTIGELEFNQSNVIIDQNTLELENAVINNTFEDGFLYSYNVFIDRVIVSNNNEFIGGTLKNKLNDGDRCYQDWNEIALWNRSNGSLLFQTTHFDTYFQTRCFGTFETISVGFSPDDQFFYFRELNQQYSTYFLNNVHIINTDTYEVLAGEQDIAFTHDGRFYVTADDTIPSLVSTSHGKVRQQYDIDGKIMTATAISPDDQTIYIATHTDEIYVFPSQLPTSNAECWEVYE